MKKYKINSLGIILKLKSSTNAKYNIHEFPVEKITEDFNSNNNNNNNNNWTDARFNNMDEEIYKDITMKNTIDYLFKDELKEEMLNVKMSPNLKENIMKNTIKKPRSLYEKFSQFLNTTVEIPVSYVCAVCIALFISSTVSTLIVTDRMKMNKKIQGYTNIRVLNISGSNVILPRDMSEVTYNEKD